MSLRAGPGCTFRLHCISSCFKKTACIVSRLVVWQTDRAESNLVVVVIGVIQNYNQSYLFFLLHSIESLDN